MYSASAFCCAPLLQLLKCRLLLLGTRNTGRAAAWSHHSGLDRAFVNLGLFRISGGRHGTGDHQSEEEETDGSRHGVILLFCLGCNQLLLGGNIRAATHNGKNHFCGKRTTGIGGLIQELGHTKIVKTACFRSKHDETWTKPEGTPPKAELLSANGNRA